ncbi:MAG: AGE family epimerase/isomerase [Pseudomonadota bacterium]|nr:AGE family epimerase/isomerase [Pseudomonadota bacterium]
MSVDETHARLHTVHARLLAWLLDDVYPRWILQGVNADSGGFIEAIEADGAVRPQPLRVRVQARQIFSLARAPGLGWQRDVQPLLRRTLEFLTQHFQRADGLFRTLIGVDGRPLDERALLYDQSFILLSYAAAAATLRAPEEFEARALALRGAIERNLRASADAFHSDLERTAVRETNPHMHLLEACLAWEEMGADPGWHSWTDALVAVALQRFIRADSGALGESYTAAWLPSPGIAGRIVEPGHLFEWGWLLLRAEARHGAHVRAPAQRLIEAAERFGVREGFVLNALFEDFSVHDQSARLWPQTERLKAALAALARDPRYGSTACSAAQGVFAYVNWQTPGLWFDVRTADGCIPPSSAPASTLYHLVGAIEALQRTVHAMPG